MTKNKNLSKKQKNALPHLLAHASISEGCRSAGIGRDTYYRWCEEHDFKEELERLKSGMLEEAVEQLRFGVSIATQTLLSLCSDESAPASVRRGAAADILSFHLKWREVIDFEERLSRLESKVGA